MVDELFLSSQGGLLCASVSRSLAGQMEGLDLVSVPRKEEFPIIPDCFPCNFTFVLHAKKTNNVISDPFDDDFCCSPIPALRREKKNQNSLQSNNSEVLHDVFYKLLYGFI